jgi:hypothetical protein
MASDVWFCGDCRSVNKAREKRCYKCRVPRATAELTEATAAISAVQAKEMQTVLAQASRMGARYRPTWPLALLVIPVILATTALTFAWTNALEAAIGPDGQYLNQPVSSHSLDALSGPLLIALFGGLLIWSAWIALVVANVPALTARWPSYSPSGAFFAPIRAFRGPYRVVWGVLAILTDGRSGPRLMAVCWWVALLAAYVAPTFVILLRGPETLFQAFLVAMQVRLVLLVIAAILAIAVVVIVEREQRAALNRRASVVLGERRVLA